MFWSLERLILAHTKYPQHSPAATAERGTLWVRVSSVQASVLALPKAPLRLEPGEDAARGVSGYVTELVQPQFERSTARRKPSSSGTWHDAPPAEFFQVFIWFYVFIGLMFVSGAVLNILSGLFLGRRTHRVFSLVVAGLDCMQIPFGTVLGVFTIVVLLRDSVCLWYESKDEG